MDYVVDYKLYSILYVDDEQGNLVAFESNFSDNFTIITACKGEDALEIIKRNPSIAVVVADQRLGEGRMEGIALCEILSQEYPDIMRIILTAYNEFNIAYDAINKASIYKYILKPWDYEALKEDLQGAIDLYIFLKEQERLVPQVVDSSSNIREAQN